MLANEIAPEPQAPIYATGEINPIHTTEDKSFSLFHFNEDDEEFIDESTHEMLLGNSTDTDSLGDWHPTNLVAVHRGSSAARRVKGAILTLIIILLIYTLYRITKRIKHGCRDGQGNPKRWGKFPGFPRLQIFTSPQPASPVPPVPGRPAPRSPEASAPTYPVPFDPLGPALHHSLTLEDFNRWVKLAHNSRENAHRIAQSVNSPSIVSQVPSMESSMIDLQQGLPVGTREGLPTYAAPYLPSTARTQGGQPESATTTAPDTSARADRPIQNGGQTTDDAISSSNTGEALKRLRMAIQQSQ